MEQTDKPTLTIKLKPYLQEYLRSELGNSLYSSRRNLIGKLIRPFLMVRPADVKPEFPSGPEYITFTLPQFDGIEIRRGNYYITYENQQLIEEFLELHFKDLFYHYMKDKVRFYRSFKKCILQFCSDHHFTFDYINYEMLKKYYYRRRKEDQEWFPGDNSSKNSCREIVPAVSLGCPPVVPDMSLNSTTVFLI